MTSFEAVCKYTRYSPPISGPLALATKLSEWHMKFTTRTHTANRAYVRPGDKWLGLPQASRRPPCVKKDSFEKCVFEQCQVISAEKCEVICMGYDSTDVGEILVFENAYLNRDGVLNRDG